ncbi:hypothetical protein [Dokdonella sp.]|uniref:hypothetical protein n=1 Tax=Dokdonella sp. TaxID=2291710 RepID=UPI002F3EED39
MRTLPLFVLPFSIAMATGARAQAVDGLPDTSFGSSGQTVVAFDRGANDRDHARAIVVDAAGRSYLVGDVDTATGRKIGIVRLLANGAIDAAYGNEGNGRVVSPPVQASITVTSAALDAQGYLLVAGSRLVSGTDTSFLVCRFDSSGELANFEGGQVACRQPDFNLGGFDTDVAHSIVVQPDGRIVLAGYASTDTGTTLAVTRLLPDGSPDAGFGTGGRTTYTGAPFVSFDATRIRLNPDGSFVTAGSAYDANALHFGVIVHISADGVVDAAFDGHGYARSPSSNSDYTDVAWDPQWQRYVAIGNHLQTTMRGHVDCLLPDGNGATCPHALDAGSDFVLGYGVWFSSLLRQVDGRWLVAGSYAASQGGPTDLFVARLEPSTELDTLEFAAPDGFATHDFGLAGHDDVGTAMALQHGRILVAGAGLYTADTSDYDYGVAAFALDRIVQSGFEKP